MHPHFLWMTEANKTKPESPGKARKFGVDHAAHELVLGSFRIRLPKSRLARLGIGFALLFGGTLGFLPILGFWMLPLGFLILSNELAIVRRWRRQLSVWWARKRRPASS
jgi:hypothetical protein